MHNEAFYGSCDASVRNGSHHHNPEYLPSSFPFSSCVTSSSSPYSSSSPFGGPKKSPVQRTRSNLPCFASMALTFAKRSRMAPAADPTVRLERARELDGTTGLRESGGVHFHVALGRRGRHGGLESSSAGVQWRVPSDVPGRRLARKQHSCLRLPRRRRRHPRPPRRPPRPPTTCGPPPSDPVLVNTTHDRRRFTRPVMTQRR